MVSAILCIAPLSTQYDELEMCSFQPSWRHSMARREPYIHNSPEAIASFTDTLISIAYETVPISEYQCGFRRGRSTLNHLIRFETFLCNAFIRKQHAVAVFFDLEKAYDTTWQYGIMRDLYDLGIRGRLPILVASFLPTHTTRS